MTLRSSGSDSGSGSDSVEYIQKHNTYQSVRIRGKLIHSLYDPIKEAKRIFEPQLTTHPKDWNGNFLIIGGGLGYEVDYIKKQYPKAQVGVLFFTHELKKNSSADSSYVYGVSRANAHKAKEDLARFVDSLCAMRTRPQILMWLPSTHVWPTQCKLALKHIDALFKKMRSEDETSRHFAQRWLQNALLNIERLIAVAPSSAPSLHEHSIVIAAGPSLNEQTSLICELAHDHNIFCVGSALSHCLNHGIIPTLVFHQDASYHASYLLHEATLAHPNIKLPIVFPLSASPILIPHIPYPVSINDEVDAIFSPCMRYHTHLTQFATVTGLAIRYALSMTNGFLLLAGFDLQNTLQGSHCHPHPRLNALLQGNKLMPFSQHQSVPFLRKKSESSLTIYRNWFSEQWKERQNRRLKVLPPCTPIVGSAFSHTHYIQEYKNGTRDLTPTTKNALPNTTISGEHMTHANHRIHTDQRKIPASSLAYINVQKLQDILSTDIMNHYYDSLKLSRNARTSTSITTTIIRLHNQIKSLSTSDYVQS